MWSNRAALLTVTSFQLLAAQPLWLSLSRSLGQRTATHATVHGHQQPPPHTENTSESDLLAVTSLSVFFVYLPPVASIVLPYPSNDTYMLAGLDAFALGMLCERLRVKPKIYTNIEADGLRRLFLEYELFVKIRSIHRRMFTWNYVCAECFESR